MGNYTQRSPSGAFNVENGGTASGALFDDASPAQSISGTSTPDGTTPLSGKGFRYLTRERAAGCGIGTYGIASDGTERIGTACP